MNITVNGKIRYIGEDQEVSGDKGNHQFKIIIIETLDNSYLAIHAWDEACLLYTSPSPRDRG